VDGLIVTTREYVDPPCYRATGSLEPITVAVAPSKSSIIQSGAPVTKELYQVPVVILSSKGDVRSGVSTTQVQPLASLASAANAQVAVVSPKVGVSTTLGNSIKLLTRGGF
jgi:hypothetical protein